MKRNNSGEDNYIEINQDNIGRQNNNIQIDDNDIAVIIKTGSKSYTPVLIAVLPVFAMILSLLPGLIDGKPNIDTARYGIISLLLTSIVVFYIRFKLTVLYSDKILKAIFAINYLTSLALLLFVPEPDVFCFWMLGSLNVAMLVDLKLGLIVHFALSVFMGSCYKPQPETIIQVMLIGFLMIILSGALKQKDTVIYAAIIILSSDITLAFTLNNFIFKSSNGFNYIYSLFSILIIVILAFTIYILCSKYRKKDDLHSKHGDLHNLKLKASELSEEISNQNFGIKDQNYSEKLGDNVFSSYDILCDHDNTLLVKFKEYSETLFAHSMRIADLSFRAAIEIGADAKLALAGGLYHEIGKIKGGANYIEDSLAIADEHKFPIELKNIIKEHNIKYGKPNSLEAAIVMLSDSVESTISYIMKAEGDKYSPDKIIDSIFKLRMDKGYFDTCPLKINDFKKLKEFYIKEYANASK